MPAPAATRPDPLPTFLTEHRRYRMVALAACFGSPLLDDVTFGALALLGYPTFLDLPDLGGTSINSVLREAVKRLSGFTFPSSTVAVIPRKGSDNTATIAKNLKPTTASTS